MGRSQRIRSILFGKIGVTRGLDTTSAQNLSRIMARIPKAVTDNCVIEWQKRRGDEVDYYYYTFAGGLENTILSLIFSLRGYYCKPVSGMEGLIVCSSERLDLNMIPEKEDTITQIVEENWRGFEPLVNTGPFASLLTSKLVKKEILSQVLYGLTISRVSSMRNSPIVSSGVALW
jgi:hypothetical protein